MEDFLGNPGGKHAKNQNPPTRFRATDLLFQLLIVYHYAIIAWLLEIPN